MAVLGLETVGNLGCSDLHDNRPGRLQSVLDVDSTPCVSLGDDDSIQVRFAALDVRLVDDLEKV